MISLCPPGSPWSPASRNLQPSPTTGRKTDGPTDRTQDRRIQPALFVGQYAMPVPFVAFGQHIEQFLAGGEKDLSYMLASRAITNP